MTDFDDKNDGNSADEQGFNEAELQDIISEIENLEKEFAEPEVLTESSLESLVEEDTLHHEEMLKVAPQEVHKTDLQKQIDEELENSLMKMSQQDSSHVEEVAELSEVSMAMDSDLDHEITEVDEILDQNDDLSAFPDDLESVHVDQESSNILSLNDSPPVENKKLKTPPTFSASPVSLQAEGAMSLMMNFKIGDGDVKLFVNGNQGVTLSFEGVEVHMSEEEGCVVEMTNGVKFNIPLKEKIAKKNVA